MLDLQTIQLPEIAADQGELASLGMENLLAQVWQPSFPSPELVDEAASFLPDERCPREPREGPSWRISVSPGNVRVWTKDEARTERTENRQLDSHQKVIDAQAAFMEMDEYGELLADVPEGTPTRTITEWSRKSRANMVRTFGDLDYTPLFEDPTRIPGMATLTYPGCWLRVAPRGAEVKKHMKALRKRYERAYGEPLRCVWKFELQGRHPDKWCRCEHCDGLDDGRAPHVHMLICPPHVLVDGRNFRQWLSDTWADVVDHPDPVQRANHVKAGTGVDLPEGLRCSDPRRLAVYFAKHGSFKAKEYQHCVPQAWQEPGNGPGRFWGYWGLKPKIATVAVSPEVGTLAGRTVRRWSEAQQVTRAVSRPRAKGGVPVSKYPEVIGLAGAQLMQSRKVKYRNTRVRAVRCKNGRGWVSVNSGSAFAFELAATLRQQLEYRDQGRPSGTFTRSVDT